MNSPRTFLYLVLLALLGCILPFQPPAAPPLNWQQLIPVDGLNAGQNLPSIADGRVLVRLDNASEFDAFVRVTMRVVGERVHFSERTVAGGATEIIVGPDRADSVLVEITLDGAAAEQPLRTFFLGKHFQSGDTITVLITAEPEPEPQKPEPPEPNQPNEPNEPVEPNLPEPAAVFIENLDEDIPVNPGMIAAFDVRVTGDRSAAARVDVFAEYEDLLRASERIAILTDAPADDLIPVQWTVPELAPGYYPVGAELRDGAALVNADRPAGRIWVRFAPQLTFDSPRPDQIVTHGHELLIAWAGVDHDDDASITIFLDTNNSYDGDEQILRSGISEDDVNDREHVLDTSTVDAGLYYVGGLIDDGLSTASAHAGPVIITTRLVGRFTPSDFGPDEITTITGYWDNERFGASLDCSGGLNGTQLTADLLVGDPAARRPDDDRGGSGAVYYFHDDDANWAPAYTADDASLTLFGGWYDSLTGQRCALIKATGPAEPGDHDVLVGAPSYYGEYRRAPDGRAYVLDGYELSLLAGQNDIVEIDWVQPPLCVQLWGDDESATGLDVAALGDLDGSGKADYAIGATGLFTQDRTTESGGVFVFSGDRAPPVGYVWQYADLQLSAADPNDLTGYAICGVPDANGDQYDELAIGAPRGQRHDPNSDPGPVTGAVYLIFGASDIFDTNQPMPLGTLGHRGMPAGRIFAGESDSDMAGFSLASGDFDKDGRPDLLIGAPACDKGRGRVYLVYDVGSPDLPQPPGFVDLGLVGSVYPGATFDGIAVGDQLGYSVHGADFDGNGVDDLLIGAPAVESQRGAAYLVYGCWPMRLEGPHQLSDIATIALAGWELVGDPNEVSRLGEALSSGNLNGDKRDDLALGAPGGYEDPGRAYLLWGWPAVYKPTPSDHGGDPN